MERSGARSLRWGRPHPDRWVTLCHRGVVAGSSRVYTGPRVMHLPSLVSLLFGFSRLRENVQFARSAYCLSG